MCARGGAAWGALSTGRDGRLLMRETGRIESLSYGTIYILGCIVAAFLSFSQSSSLERLLLHTVSSWGYVVYWVMNVQ
jgi:hypothetical protein